MGLLSLAFFTDKNLERVMGIEPTSSAWKADVLPLNYTRLIPTLFGARHKHPSLGHRPAPHPCGSFVGLRMSTGHSVPPHPLNYTRQYPLTASSIWWWRGEDSNLRRLSRQIYSLLPLATREPLRNISGQIYKPYPRLSTNSMAGQCRCTNIFHVADIRFIGG